jgi:hypothetical protein
MWTQLATFQWRIDGYMKDLEPLLAETEVWQQSREKNL